MGFAKKSQLKSNLIYLCINLILKWITITFLAGWELSEPEELSDPLEDEELDPEDELFDELEVEAEALPLSLCLRSISEERNMKLK